MPCHVQAIQVVDQSKADKVPNISTGIGFLDHMIDQWNSHAQVGVGIHVIEADEDDSKDNSNDSVQNRFAGKNQVELLTIVGNALGSELKKVLQSNHHSNQESKFSCPLDEALVTCVLSSSNTKSDKGSLVFYNLAPYGIYPSATGRTKIGKLETFAIESFWKALAESSTLCISLTKLRGDNAHHIVESSFKAFSRALRNYLDPPDLWEPQSANDEASIRQQREGKVERKTKETSISVNLLLNGCSKSTHVETGIPLLNAFYTTLAQEAHMTLQIDCQGDLWVDDHHTAEDVSIAIGQCLTQALGSKAGLNRMWVGRALLEDGTTVEVTMDLSNRPCFVHNLHETLGRQEYVEETADDDEFANKSLLSCEMLEHCLDSLVMNGRMTVHVVVVKSSTANESSVADVVLGTAQAFGRALRVCAMVDQRRAGTTASSKGTLSV
ncbi:imidazoleglycerol-phosphate dehydratase [Nitzschia inconspicua]|uniref:imidazoleglycerol-phosphate dehydratase n=1 Tax=Nitzschia inconspicua TaxID=303405 RepID=A0A9K3L6L9_9STRA|nr:imidazoleglycerol-phosphate dehydratase [Nitzschia inconspicua]